LKTIAGFERHMDTTTWQLEVSKQLGSLIQQTSDLTEQVKRQNGNVARLWEHMGTVEAHPATCPLNERVAAVESRLASDSAVEQAEAKATAPWHRWAERLVFVIFGVIGVLVLMHGEDILKAWKG
jgi:hypothetical protein